MKKKGIKLIILFAAVAAVIVVAAAYFLIPNEIRKVAGIDDGQELYIGEKVSPEYKIKPGKFNDKKDKLIFAMSDQEVASVDSKGEIQAKKLGETVLTISVMSYTEDFTVKVVPKIKEIKNVKETISLTEGDYMTLSPEIVPAEKRFSNEQISYKVKNKNVISISKEGTIRALMPGSTILKISCGGCEKSVKVVVNEYIPEPVTTAPQQIYTQSTPAQKTKKYTPKKQSNDTPTTVQNGSDGWN